MYKKALVLGKKSRGCVHLWVKFCIQNIVLGVSRRKNSKIFPCGAFYSCVFNKMFIEVPLFHETSPAFITPLEKVFRPPHFENIIRHQATRKNYVLRTSPRRLLDVLRTSPLGPICNAKGSIHSGLPLGRTQDVILTTIHKIRF